MTSKVEELLERLLRVDKTPLYCAQGDCGYAKGKHIPTRVELEELVAEGVAEGAERVASQIREAAIPIIPEAHICVDDKGFVFMDPCPYLGSKESYGAKVFLVGASVLAPTKEKP